MIPKQCRGFALMEMLAIMAALVVVMVLMVKPMRMMLAEVPQSHRDFQTWMRTIEMLEQLKDDVERSQGMRIFEVDPRISEKLLYLEQADGLVSYCLADGKVTRQSTVAGDDASAIELPHVKIHWQFLTQNGQPIALEITTWGERTVLGHPKKEFEQSYLYFQKTGSTKP